MRSSSPSPSARIAKLAADLGLPERRSRIAERQAGVLSAEFEASVHAALGSRFGVDDRTALVSEFTARLAVLESGVQEQEP